MFDAGWHYITQRSEPLFSDAPGNIFAGEIEGDDIRWAGGGGLDVRRGDKLARGEPTGGGVSIATWAA